MNAEEARLITEKALKELDVSGYMHEILIKVKARAKQGFTNASYTVISLIEAVTEIQISEICAQLEKLDFSAAVARENGPPTVVITW